MKKIFVALSGGVDSAVAAALLVRGGHEVTGVYMKNWSSSEGLSGSCPYLADRRDAIRVAAHLDISFREVDFESEYRDRVYHYFVQSYRQGRTPNPDVVCNREIKFGLLLEYALANGAEALATGHYARALYKEGEWQLLRAVDRTKDQSYFLHSLSEGQLALALFPLGGLEKREVRALAREFGLPNADRPDSQGLCFIGEVDLKDFLGAEIPTKAGAVLDEAGERVGSHPGAAYYTVGQREGLGVALAEPRYVVATDVLANTVQLGEESELLRHGARLEQLHWIGAAPPLPLHCQAQIRYRAEPVGALLHDGGRLEFGTPVRALAPGQFAVILQGDHVLGGGEIAYEVPLSQRSAETLRR